MALVGMFNIEGHVNICGNYRFN